MELRFFLIMALVAVSLIPMNQAFAHHNICEICGTPDDVRIFTYVSFDLYVPVEHQDRAIAFLNDFNSNIQTSTIRSTSIVPDAVFVDRNDSLMLVRGAVIFQSLIEAQRAYNDLVSLTTVDRNAIEFGRIIITENTHHYPNPLPDVVLNSDIKGVRENLERFDVLFP